MASNLSDPGRDFDTGIAALLRLTKWRNLYFMKDGVSLLGQNTFDSERLAQEAADQDLTRLQSRTGIPSDENIDVLSALIGKELSHAIAIPWRPQ